jgi:hypothetical protein
MNENWGMPTWDLPTHRRFYFMEYPLFYSSSLPSFIRPFYLMCLHLYLSRLPDCDLQSDWSSMSSYCLRTSIPPQHIVTYGPFLYQYSNVIVARQRLRKHSYSNEYRQRTSSGGHSSPCLTGILKKPNYHFCFSEVLPIWGEVQYKCF